MTAKLSRKPLQIYLRQDQLDNLRGLAKKRSSSLTELVRQAVDHLLTDTPVKKDPLPDIVGPGNPGLGNLAKKRDVLASNIVAGEQQFTAGDHLTLKESAAKVEAKLQRMGNAG